MLSLLHSGFVLSVLNIFHVLDLESVCLIPNIYTAIFLHTVFLLTCSISYLLFLFVDLWNINKMWCHIKYKSSKKKKLPVRT